MPRQVDVRCHERIPSTSPPQITIQRRGTLAINCAAFEALGSPAAVELLFDVDHRILGLRAIATTDANGYPVRGAGTPSTRYLIAGAAFTKYHNIATEMARRWYAELDDDVLFIDLTTPCVELGEQWTRYARAQMTDRAKRRSLTRRHGYS